MLHILQVAVVFLLMITLLVAAHELGHYLFARLFRMGVLEFSLGFGRPKLFTWRRTRARLDDGGEIETEFNVRAWPLGGFVRILGMEPQEDGSETRIANGFYSKPAWQRFVVLLAGPVFSVLTGLFVLAPVYLSVGAVRESTTIADVDPTFGAYAAGVRQNDVVVAIDGRPVRTGYEARTLVRDRLSGEIALKLLRGGRPLEVSVVPKVDQEPMPTMGERGDPNLGEQRRQARLGIRFLPVRRPLGPMGAFAEAGAKTLESVKGFGFLLSRPKVAKENVNGIVGMVGRTSEAVDSGLEDTFGLAALLSISIGLFNLIPIPPLDGGQMLIAAIEMLRSGKRLSLRLQNTFFTIGFALMVTLFVGVFVLDISRRLGGAGKGSTPGTQAAPELPAKR